MIDHARVKGSAAVRVTRAADVVRFDALDDGAVFTLGGSGVPLRKGADESGPYAENLMSGSKCRMLPDEMVHPATVEGVF